MNESVEVQVEDLPEALARQHLPDALKESCIVVPKRIFQWAAFNVMLLGIGIGMLLGSILAEWIEPASLAFGFPVAFGLAWLIGRTVLARTERQFLERGTAE